MKPLVSVITPAYNCERYIDRTIFSVFRQTYDNIEYIVVDDGSTDGTLDKLMAHASHMKRVVIQENKGEQHAVNAGLAEVQGDYFTIVNADDPILPRCIEYLVEVMECAPEILCAYPDWRMIDANDHVIQHMKMRDYDFNFMVRHHWCLPSVGSLFRASVIVNVGFRDPTFKYVGDFDYWLRVGLAGKMLHVNKELATWRKDDNSQLSGEINHIRHSERLVLMDKFYSMPDIPEDIRAVKDSAYSWACLVAASLSGTLRLRLAYIIRAVRYYPHQLLTFDFWYSAYKYLTYYFERYWK